MALVLAGFLSFVLGNWLAITTGILAPLQAAMLSFALLGVGVFVYSRGLPDSDLEPAHEVRRSGFALALSCPFCHTPMEASRSGIATCVYCESRFRIA
jgi:hypothetical protein